MDTLLVFVEEPRAGISRRGLCPPLTPVQAALLSRAMLVDLLAQALGAGIQGLKIVLCFSPGSTPGFVAGPYAWQKQEGPDVGSRLSHAFDSAFAAGASRVAAVAADHPSLPAGVLALAFSELAHKSLVLGPGEQGGSYLIGMGRRLPALFESVEWNSPFAAEAVRRMAQAMGLTLAELQPWYDVARPQELTRLRAELALDPPSAPATAALLASLA